MHAGWLIWLRWLANLLAAAAACYSLLALIAVVGWRFRRRAMNSGFTPPVTVLKPLCGAEHGLYACLRTFCAQRYGRFQIVFGVSDTKDPALAVVRRLQSEYANLDITVIIDGRRAGCNRKAANLANMMRAARHDYLVIADSDIKVGPDYLTHVVAPLADQRIGLVTCLYRDAPARGLWSRLGGLFVDDWFAPAVLVSRMLGSQTFAFGATLALTRATLAAAGGFAAVADYLADDHRLGALVRARGLRSVLCDYAVATVVHEPSVRALLRHEARWMRTLRVLQPRAYWLLFVSFGLAVSPVAALLAWGRGFALAALGVTVAARLAVAWLGADRSDDAFCRKLGLLPLRDALLMVAWFRGLITRQVRWRAQRYRVDRNGRLYQQRPWD